MRIEEGRFYRTRTGKIVGPMKRFGSPTKYCWNEAGHPDGRWSDDGEDGYASRAGATEMDLIEEWSLSLTQIETAYGILLEKQPEIAKALRECGGPWERYTNNGDWAKIPTPAWEPSGVYRLKPQPPKPREFWLVREHADRAWQVMHREPKATIWADVIPVREVLE
jgi:hypothetical protein